MKLITKLWKSILSLDNQQFLDKIEILQQHLKDKDFKIKQWEVQHDADVASIKKYKTNLLKSNEENVNLSHKLVDLNKKYLPNPLYKKLNNNYPKGYIVYKGRPLPYGKYNVEFPVNVLITPTDFNIILDLKRWGLYQTGEDYETLIPKIYKKIQTTYYKYETDKAVWGHSEVWELPFETRTKFEKGNGLDCDSWSSFEMSYYVAAGMPEAFGRIVVGNCELGGHSTDYIYSVKDGKWHHLNSTYGRPKSLNKISDYPTHKDAYEGRDKLGIIKVWFSFNRLYSWYKFGKDIPEELELK